MAFWTIDFKSLSGTLYRISIGGATTNIRLQGADSPIFTQEDQSEDKFIPVRTQSGYIRIFDDGYDLDGNAFDWHELIPSDVTSRPVTLYEVVGNVQTVRWKGFIRQETFSGTYMGNPQEREFPIMCQLSALQGFFYEQNARSLNFAAVIADMLTVSGISFDDFVFQGTYSVLEWLMYKFCNMNFMKAGEVPSYTYFDILEEICRFWGWTARSFESMLFFESADDTSQMAERDFSSIDLAELSSIAAGTQESGAALSFSSIQLADGDWADDQNTETLLLPINRAEVKADINEIDDYPAVPYDEIEKTFATEQIYQDTYGTSSHVYKFYHVNTLVASKSYRANEMDIETYMQTISTVSYGAWFDVVDWYTGELTNKINYDWKCRLNMLGSYSVNTEMPLQNNNPYLRMKSLIPYLFDNGAIVISATTYMEKCTTGSNASYQTFTGKGSMTCRLAVGDKWWNGSAWTTTKSTFTINIGTTGAEGTGKGAIITNKTYTSPYESYTGFGVPVSEQLDGDVTFEIVSFQVGDLHDLSQANLVVEDLKISHARPQYSAALNTNKQNTYSASNTSDSPKKTETSLIFASYNGNKPGYGLIFDGGGYVVSVCYDYDGSVYARPEQHLADRIASFMADPKNIYKMNLLRSEVANLSPITRVLVPISLSSNRTTYPISISHDWAEDVVNVICIEVDDSPTPPAPTRHDLETPSWTEGYYVRSSNGSLISTTGGYSHTDYIDVSGAAGKTLHFLSVQRTTSSATTGMAFYNANKSYVSGVKPVIASPDKIMTDATCVVPDNAKYARFSCLNGDTSNFYAYYYA